MLYNIYIAHSKVIYEKWLKGGLWFADPNSDYIYTYSKTFNNTSHEVVDVLINANHSVE